MTSNEGKALDAVVKWLEQREGENRADVRCPERDGCGPPVDLRLRLGLREHAFEHTRIEPFTGEIGQSKKFTELVEPLKALSGTLPGKALYRLTFPTDVDLGGSKKFEEILKAFIPWVREKAECLNKRAMNRSPEELSAHHLVCIRDTPPGFSYRVTLSRQEYKSISREYHGVLSARRFAPDDECIERLRRERLKTALCRKCPKLQCCKEQGARTVLVLESDDIALTNSDAVGEQLRPLLKDRTDLPDEIYLVESDREVTKWQLWRMTCDDQLWPVEFLKEFHIDDLTDLTCDSIAR